MALPDQRAGRTGSQAGAQAVVPVGVIGVVPVAVGGSTVVGVVVPGTTTHHPLRLPSPLPGYFSRSPPGIPKTIALAGAGVGKVVGCGVPDRWQKPPASIVPALRA
jgi:hypothetical protein